MIGRVLGAGLKVGAKGALGTAKAAGKSVTQFGSGLSGINTQLGRGTLSGFAGRTAGQTTKGIGKTLGRAGAGVAKRTPGAIKDTGTTALGGLAEFDRTMLNKTPRSLLNPVGRRMKPGIERGLIYGGIAGAGALGYSRFKSEGNLGDIKPREDMMPSSMEYSGNAPQRPRHPQDMGATGDLVFALHNMK